MSEYAKIMKDIDKARQEEKRFQALKRLENTSDFRLLFNEGLFKEELTRVVMERHGASPEDKDVLNQAADSISFLGQYLDQIKALGQSAQYRINEGLKLLDELNEDA
ncbi:TPA: hypothetical protein ACGIKE_003445 [Acinetobacter baumannii]|uniref:hypothetical protein n=1 Tax=Acinetobacter baumannii TaxID=470 RepID=UPI003390516B